MNLTSWYHPESGVYFDCYYEWQTNDYDDPAFKPYVVVFEVFISNENSPGGQADIYELLSNTTIQRIEMDIANEAL